jgi:hypothetical protein
MQDQCHAVLACAQASLKFSNQRGKVQNASDFGFPIRTALTILPDFFTISSGNHPCLANDTLAQSPGNPYISPQIIRHHPQARATVAAAGQTEKRHPDGL